MEFLLFLLYPAGFVGIVGTLFLYLRRQETGQRAIRSLKAHLTPAEDVAAGYAAVEASVKRLRAAKNEEQALLVTQWEQQFYSPEEYKELQDKRRHGKMVSSKAITGAKFVSGGKDMLSLTEEEPYEGPEWLPLPDHKNANDLSYSQRRIQSAGAFVREAPSTSAKVYGVAEGGSVMRFDGYVRGEAVAGNDVWFVYVGAVSGLYKFVHSVATTNRSTSGLQDFTEYDRHAVKTPDGAVIRTIMTPSGYIQMPVAEVARRVAEDRAWAAKDRRQGKYDPVPKEFIPSQLRKSPK